MAAAIVLLAACQKNKEAEAPVDATAIEAQTDTVAKDIDTVTTAEVVKEEDAVKVAATDKKEAEVKPVQEVKAETKGDYAAFGDKIVADKALSKEEMLKKYKGLKAGDTIAVKFKSKIKDVCQKKGCWMAMQLPNEKQTFVKFKDYAFFVPLNAADQEAIVSGKAFISETSVAQLRHYAKDGGKSEAEIAKITEPKIEYKFLADGVLISK
ncbi:DUF4920 domain-containing protein [Flavobacterium cerinum]|uniref:DUF4920 domain-containing protein n=2 Tax=Flavobacterium cerinum TaxID=2502784 RepID=A0A444GMI0_9FLAO|nr:DUF4920 domain-containing protein [Flavobacterium cerinum]